MASRKFVVDETLQERNFEYDESKIFYDPNVKGLAYLPWFKLDGEVYQKGDIIILDSGDDTLIWVAVIGDIYYDEDELDWYIDSKWFYNANSDDVKHTIKLPNNEVFLSLNHFDPNLISTIKRHCDVEFCIYEFPETSKLSKGKFYCRYIYDNKNFLFYRLYTDPSVFHNKDDREAFEYNVTLYSDKLKGTSDNKSKVMFNPKNLSDALKYPVISTKPSGGSVKLNIKHSTRSRTKESDLRSPAQDSTSSPPPSSSSSSSAVPSSVSSPIVPSPYFTKETPSKEKSSSSSSSSKQPEKSTKTSKSSHKRLDKPLSDTSTVFGSESTDSDSDEDDSDSEQYRSRAAPPPKKRLTRESAARLRSDASDSQQHPTTRQHQAPSSVAVSSPPTVSPGSLQAYESAEAAAAAAAGKGRGEENKRLCPYFLCGVCPLGELCSLSHEFPKPPLRYEPPKNIGHFKNAVRGLIVGKDEILSILQKYYIFDDMSCLEDLYVIRNCGFGIRSGDVKYRIGKIIRVVNCFSCGPEDQEKRFGLVIGCERIPETEIVTKIEMLVNPGEIDEETMHECMSRYVTEVAKHKVCQLPSYEEIEELKGKINTIKSKMLDKL